MPKYDLDEILSRCDLQEIVERYGSLQDSGWRRIGGNRLRRRCPFPDHSDQNPSFTIVDHDGWVCTCQHGDIRGGGVLNFMRVIMGLEYASKSEWVPKVAEELAQFTGVAESDQSKWKPRHHREVVPEKPREVQSVTTIENVVEMWQYRDEVAGFMEKRLWEPFATAKLWGTHWFTPYFEHEPKRYWNLNHSKAPYVAIPYFHGSLIPAVKLRRDDTQAEAYLDSVWRDTNHPDHQTLKAIAGILKDQLGRKVLWTELLEAVYPKKHGFRGNQEVIYNANFLRTLKPDETIHTVVWVEGEPDVAAISSVFKYPYVVGGHINRHNIHEVPSLFQNVAQVLVPADDDPAGHMYVNKIAEAVGRHKVIHLLPPTPYKDSGDALEAGVNSWLGNLLPQIDHQWEPPTLPPHLLKKEEELA